MTELAGLGKTFPLYGRHKLGSIGVPLPYCEARSADTEDVATNMPRGEVGELMVRGPILMQGYWNSEEATRETIESDGWLHTGDLASMVEDGAIFIVDRKKDMSNTGGFNVFPAEIERVVATHSDVALVAVGGVPDQLKGEIAKAYVVLKPGAKPDAARCRAVAFVEDLPKTSIGKIMRRELCTLEAV
jgi:long-chain acyl-CoA synthetase